MKTKPVLLIAAFAIFMTNSGIRKDPGYTFSCPQYYLDYVVFLGLGIALYAMVKFMRDKLANTSIYNISAIVLTIIFAYSFSALYASITGCDFNSLFFYSSKAPLIGAYAIGIILTLPRVRAGSQRFHWIKTADRSLVKIDDDEISYVELKNQVTRIHTRSNKEFICLESMKSICDKITSEEFYRANRQVLVNRAAVKKIIPENGNGLRLILDNDFQTIVNKNRTVEFKMWFNRDSV